MSSISSHFVGAFGGLVMSCIAFSIVFLVIVGLMLVMMGTKILAHTIEGKGKGAAQPSAPAGGTPPSTPSAPSTPAAAVAVDDGELIAVISAAVAACCGGAARVISFSPVTKHAATTWRVTGRLQNTEGFEG